MSHTEKDSNMDADRPQGSETARSLPDSKPENLDSKRRRLIKGAAIAAPAIFTLPTGASAGAFGSFAQCVRRTEDQPKYLHTGGKGRFAGDWVSGNVVAKITGITDGIPTYDHRDRHWLVKYDHGWFDERGRRWSVNNWEGHRYFTCDHPRISGRFGRIESTSRYTVGWFRDNGDLVGYDYSDRQRGRAIYQSCWISILPKAT